jgi:hypothetical protein
VNDILQSLTNNPVFSGVLGGSFVVSILYSLKSIPSHLWTLLKWQFTCRVVVFNEDSAFEAVSAWLSKHEGLRRTRQLRLTSAHSRDEDESQIVLTPGFGNPVHPGAARAARGFRGDTLRARRAWRGRRA